MRGKPKTYVATKGRRQSGDYKFPGLSSNDRHYIAGLFDGEGSFYQYPYHNGTRWGCTITNTNREVLEWVCSVMGGGNVHTINEAGYRRSNKAVYAWRVLSKAGVFGVACELYTTFRIKQPAALKIIQALSGKVRVV